MPSIDRPHARDLACRELVELVTAYVEGTLDARAPRASRRHIACCEQCRAYFEQIRVTLPSLETSTPEAVGPALERGLLDVFRKLEGRRGLSEGTRSTWSCWAPARRARSSPGGWASTTTSRSRSSRTGSSAASARSGRACRPRRCCARRRRWPRRGGCRARAGDHRRAGRRGGAGAPDRGRPRLGRLLAAAVAGGARDRCSSRPRAPGGRARRPRRRRRAARAARGRRRGRHRAADPADRRARGGRAVDEPGRDAGRARSRRRWSCSAAGRWAASWRRPSRRSAREVTMLERESAHARPRRAVRGRARAGGAGARRRRVLTDCVAESVARGADGRVAVTTSTHGVVEADEILVASGAAAPDGRARAG